MALLFARRLERVLSVLSCSPSPALASLLVDPSCTAAFDLVRGRLVGGWEVSVAVVVFRCLLLVTAWEVESPASSPEASREEGWRRSAVEDCAIEVGPVRFRLPDPEDEGEDIAEGY